MYKKLIFLVLFAFLSAYAGGPLSLFAASASIDYFYTSTTVPVGTQIFFRVNPLGFPGSIVYSVTDSLSGSSVSNSRIDSYGSFVWTPTLQDVGTHNIIINLSDSSGNTASVTQQITVPFVPTVVIQNLFPSTSVNAKQTVFFNAFATGFTNPTYYASDSVYNSSMTATNMNASGGFSWTPREFDAGSHVITVLVTDSAGHRATATQTITVGVATTTITLLSPGNTVASKQNVTFKVTPTGFTNPTHAVSDSVSGSSIGNGNINGLGIFSWTPTINDLGTHLITIKTSDTSGNTSTISQQITVTSPKIEILSVNPGTAVNVGTILSFIATSTGLTNPNYTITDSLSGTSVSKSSRATTGGFSWTPKGNDLGSHTIRILAMDNYGSSANGEVLVTVKPQTNAVISYPAGSGIVTPPTNTKTTVTNYTFKKYLSLGSSGADVSALQTILKQKGFLSGDITGYYGNLTTKAVRDFQLSKGLEQAGVIGPRTRVALNSLSNTTTTSTPPTTSATPGAGTNTAKYTFTKPLTIGSAGTEVFELQKKLTSLGLYSGPITGTYNSLTWEAVKKFQSQHNLEQVGSIGPGTRNALNNN
ncbi:MAG: peptidoglycan-binding protein [Candidatus Paceibacterota bacterium]|jgi:peptidoglycan hydrolase-like protein with peptidoglycan-binding domain